MPSNAMHWMVKFFVPSLVFFYYNFEQIRDIFMNDNALCKAIYNIMIKLPENQ